jgi:hypothetical protein
MTHFSFFRLSNLSAASHTHTDRQRRRQNTHFKCLTLQFMVLPVLFLMVDTAIKHPATRRTSCFRLLVTNGAISLYTIFTTSRSHFPNLFFTFLSLFLPGFLFCVAGRFIVLLLSAIYNFPLATLASISTLFGTFV